MDEDIYELAPGKVLEIEAERQAAAEEQETIKISRQVKLRSVRMMPKILGMCEEAIDNKEEKYDFSDRIKAARLVLDTAGIAKVMPAQIYVDQRQSSVVSDEEQQFLADLGMAPAPQAKRQVFSNVIDTECRVLEPSEPQEPAKAAPEREKAPRSDDLPDWCLG